jgi:ubiquinone/menaquinone biosynthesis C-methylase UbiE
MIKGIIEGKRASEYEEKIKGTKRTRIFDGFILKNVKFGKSIKVCDFCCGPGNNIELLKGKVGKIVGVDLSKEMIKICRNKFKNNKSIELKIASITNTKLKSNYFDYVTIRMGLHHVKEKNNVLEEAYRLLKPKGKLIIIDKYYLSLFELYGKAFYRLIFQRNPAIFQEYTISKRANEKLFKNRKFKITKKEIPLYDKKYVGQSFMYVLQKK